MCGECCYGKGGIYLKEEEIRRIVGFLKMAPDAFIAGSCEHRNGRIYIRTGDDGFCLFYDHEKRCLIHPVKPGPCFLWPFYPALLQDRENWEMAREACPGINPHCLFENFIRQAKE